MLLKLKILLYELKILSQNRILFLLSFWRKSVDRVTSIKLLEDYVIYQVKHQRLDLSSLESPEGKSTLTLRALKDPNKIDEVGITIEDDFVWKLCRDSSLKSINISSSGAALVNKKMLLNLDFGSFAGLRDSPLKIRKVEYPLVVAPWSHLFRCGYYDFIAYILAKLCRVEASLSQAVWKSAKVCYPLLHTRFESQYLRKLGISEDSVIDTRTKGLQIEAQCLLVANTQSKTGRISPADVALLRNRFCQPIASSTKRRIFLPRRGRRVLQNETEIRELLNRYEFEVVEDEYRSVDEQIRLFQEASIVVGIHGAGLANFLWCSPGTKVIELFHGGYKRPTFYYLSQLLGLEYSYVVDESVSSQHIAYKFQNLTIDVDILRKELERMLI